MSSSASLELITTLPSKAIPGSSAGRVPVAITILFVFTSSTPSFDLTTTFSRPPTSASPMTSSTPFPLQRASMPETSLDITCDLHF